MRPRRSLGELRKQVRGRGQPAPPSDFQRGFRIALGVLAAYVLVQVLIVLGLLGGFTALWLAASP
jgi:hypothetical protein